MPRPQLGHGRPSRPRTFYTPRHSATSVALVVGDNTALTAGDGIIQSRLFALGFQVFIVDDQAAADLSRQLVVIAESISGVNVGTKYRNAPMPVVNLDHALNDDMDFISPASVAGGNEDNLLILNPSHPMAGGFSGLNLVQSPAARIDFSDYSALAPTAQIVYSTEGSSSQIVGYAFEAGAQLLNGHVAEARRVFVGLAPEASVSTLNATGLALIDAAILWALGTFTFDPAQIPWTTTTPDPVVPGFIADDTSQPWAVTAPAAAPAFDPANGFPWRGEADPTVNPAGADDTIQSWAIQVPAVVAFNPASGFPWTAADEPRIDPLGFDDTAQAWTIQLPPPFVPVFEESSPTPLGFDESIQAWAVTAPPFVQSTDEPVVAVPGQDDTPQSWAIQPPAAAGSFDPGTGFPWAREESFQQQPVLDPSEQAWAVQPIAAAPAFDPSTGFPWTSAQDYVEQPQWDDTEQPWVVQPPLPPFVLNAHDDIVQPLWWDATAQSWPVSPPAAAFDPSTGFPWQYDSVLDRIPDPWTVLPDAVGVWFTTLPPPDTTVTGGYGPTGYATAPALYGAATDPVPDGRATAPLAGGSAATPAPVTGGSAPKPAGSATNPTPRR